MRPVLISLLLVVLAAPPYHARDEWYDHYEEALAALARQDHATAVQHLEAALERKKRSGYLRTYGNNYVRYVPRFQLGVALHGLDECEGALASFEASESRGELSQSPGFAVRLQTLRTECEARLAPAPVEPDPVVADPVPVLNDEPPEPQRRPIDRPLLQRGLAAYLGGDFETSSEVFDTLARSTPESGRLRLLLGMSLHNTWALGGETDAALIERAREELAGAARLDPGLVPDPALCPPRVAALFRSLR